MADDLEQFVRASVAGKVTHENVEKVIASIEKLRELTARRDQLTIELLRSSLIMRLWPEAFQGGKLGASIVGSKWSGYRYVLRRTDGERREWPIADVPKVLIAHLPPFNERTSP